MIGRHLIVLRERLCLVAVPGHDSGQTRVLAGMRDCGQHRVLRDVSHPDHGVADLFRHPVTPSLVRYCKQLECKAEAMQMNFVRSRALRERGCAPVPEKSRPPGYGTGTAGKPRYLAVVLYSTG